MSTRLVSNLGVRLAWETFLKKSDVSDGRMKTMIVIDGPYIVDTSDLGPHRDEDGVLKVCDTCVSYSPNSKFGCALGYIPCDYCADWKRCDTGCDKTRCGDCPLTEVESLP